MCPRSSANYCRARPSSPIHLAFSDDEEVGCLGVSRMIDIITAKSRCLRSLIVGEPTNMQIANTHKSICAKR